jgi:predicted RND superfamily exporter protein
MSASQPAIAQAILRHRMWVCALALALTGVAVWRVSSLEISTDVMDLLAPDDPVLKATRRLHQQMPFSAALIAVIDAPRADALTDAIGDTTGLPDVKQAMLLPFKLDGRRLVAISLATGASDVAHAQRSIETVREVMSQHGLDAQFTGTPALLAEAHRQVYDDLRRAGIIALVAVALFFGILYRIGWVAALALVPVAVGITWGLAAIELVAGRLTLLAAMVPTLLIGLGIDHFIHLVQATGVHVRAGTPRDEAIVRAWSELLRPLAVCTVTTAAAFFSLSVAGLRGLAEMGWAGGVTTVAVFAASMLLMPVVLSLCPKRVLARETVIGRWAQRPGRVTRHRLALGAIAGAVTVAGVVGMTMVRLETDNSRLENRDLPARVLQEQLARSVGYSTTPLVLEFETRAAAKRFVAGPPGDALSRIDLVPFVKTGLVAVHPVGNPFARPVYERARAEVERRAKSVGAMPCEVAGAPVVNARLTNLLEHDWPRVMGAALGVVVIVLSLTSGGVRRGLVALVPLACGIIWTAGLLGFAGVAVSIMSIGVAPLVLGIGVDDGVHMLMARRRRGGRTEQVFADTGVAVVATTVTTVAAFAAFCFSATPALVQFGWQATVGLTFCLFGSLFVLPVVWGRASSAKQPD